MNNTIFFFFYNLAYQSNIFDNIVIFLAVYFIYIDIFLAGLYLLFYYKISFSQNFFQQFVNKWREFSFVILSVGVTWFFNKFIAKILFYVFRPFIVFSQVLPLFPETGYAFPSGHTAVASALAFSLFFINKKAGLPAQAGYVFMFFALLIGLARVIAGVHFPIDILGGFFLGFLMSFIFNYIFNSFSKKL
ncbi:MAG: phosphatase PAP2 family protein [Candidatus Paceibacterota bacterium]|jgi:undecaprenyl-diphosphatase